MYVLSVCVLDTSVKIAKKYISCEQCVLKHPNILYIPSKERGKYSDQIERRLELIVHSSLVSSHVTGDHSCIVYNVYRV